MFSGSIVAHFCIQAKGCVAVPESNWMVRKKRRKLVTKMILFGHHNISQQLHRIYFFNLLICIFTLPGIFRAMVSSFTPFSKSFSLVVHVLSFKNIIIAVLAALPRRPVPGVSFTLNLLERVTVIATTNTILKILLEIMQRLIWCNNRNSKQNFIFFYWTSSQRI